MRQNSGASRDDVCEIARPGVSLASRHHVVKVSTIMLIRKGLDEAIWNMYSYLLAARIAYWAIVRQLGKRGGKRVSDSG